MMGEGTIWPERNVIFAWLEKHGIGENVVSHQQAIELSEAITTCRLKIQADLTRERDNRGTYGRIIDEIIKPNWAEESGKARTHEYYDVCYLNALGYWPNHKVPEWTKEIVVRMGYSLTNFCIIEYAFLKEIAELRQCLLLKDQ